MKRALFVGCGVILLVILGIGGFLYFALSEPYAEFVAQTELQKERIAALDAAHPFDAEAPLDADRFGRHLALRVDVIAVFLGLERELESVQGREDLGWFDGLRAFVAPMIGAPAALIDEFERAEMSPTEFAHHSRLLWAAMRELDKGTGGDRFSSVRGRYSELRRHYEREFGDMKEMPPLDELIGGEDVHSQQAVDTALHIMGQDLELLLEATQAFSLEIFAMQLDRFGEEEGAPFLMPMGEQNEGVFR